MNRKGPRAPRKGMLLLVQVIVNKVPSASGKKRSPHTLIPSPLNYPSSFYHCLFKAKQSNLFS